MYKHFFKQLIDFVASFLALIVLMVPLIVIAVILAIRIKGNPFFFQSRPGKNGRVFKMIKFKTMSDEKDENGNLLSDSLRVTGIGRILRKTSLDELPELLNILKGDMSIVGPRPLLVKYLPYFTETEQKRHLVRPGITGLAQVNGRHLLSWDERLAMDVKYSEEVSFMLDVKIIFSTFFQVVGQKDVMVVSSEVMPDFDDYRKQNPK